MTWLWSELETFRERRDALCKKWKDIFEFKKKVRGIFIALMRNSNCSNIHKVLGSNSTFF